MGEELEIESSEKAEVTQEDIEMEVDVDGLEEIGEPVIEEIDSNVTAEVNVDVPVEPEDVPSVRSSSTKKAAPAPVSEDINVQEVAKNATSTADTMVQEILVTAKARTAAEESKIDLTTIQGTGESGCITLDDVKL